MSGGFFMGKKSKIKKLTDEQYTAYISGLKEQSTNVEIAAGEKTANPDDGGNNGK